MDLLTLIALMESDVRKIQRARQEKKSMDARTLAKALRISADLLRHSVDGRLEEHHKIRLRSLAGVLINEVSAYLESASTV